MSAVREIARFRSPRFLPVLPEASQLAPGVYGAELAFWLAEKLARRGIATSYPRAGERCWVLEFQAEAGAAFRLRCANIDGSDQHWHLALEGAGAAPPFEAARPLVNAIRFVLYRAAPREAIAWRYPDGEQVLPYL